MTPLEAALRRIIDELVELDRSYALVGGLAVSARADPRFTRDADIAVSVLNDADAEGLVGVLRGSYEILTLVEQESTGRLATVRLAARDEDHPVVVDLLFASSGIEHEIAEGADELEILPGLTVRVASVGHLIAMKLLARDDRRRPADADDLAALRTIATADDWTVAERGVAQISERGADRGRDLHSALAVLKDSGAF